MNYGHAIKVARTRRGMSQKQLAGRIKADSSFLSMLESGKRKPSTETLEAICDVLGVPLYLLMLLASEKKDLKGVSAAQAADLGRQLLDILIKGVD